MELLYPERYLSTRSRKKPCPVYLVCCSLGKSALVAWSVSDYLIVFDSLGTKVFLRAG